MNQPVIISQRVPKAWNPIFDWLEYTKRPELAKKRAAKL